jgi:hypothetical protein
MAYRNTVGYFDGIQKFIIELNENGRTEASNKVKECYDYINEHKDGWKMFYRNLLLVKEEYEFKFTKDENIEIDGIIEAAKRVVCSL